MEISKKLKFWGKKHFAKMTDTETFRKGCREITITDINRINDGIHQRLNEIEKKLSNVGLVCYTGIMLILAIGFRKVFTIIR